MIESCFFLCYTMNVDVYVGDITIGMNPIKSRQRSVLYYRREKLAHTATDRNDVPE